MTSAAATIFPEDDRPHLAGWIIAALIVVAAHVILGLVILYMRDEAPMGEEAPPAIMIDLAPVAAAPPAEEKLDVPEAPEKMEEAPPEEVKPPPPDVTPPDEPPPEPQMVQPDEPPPPDMPPPPPVEQPPAIVVPEAPLAPKPEVVLAPPPKPAPPKPAPKVEKKIEKPVVKHEQKPPAQRTAAPRPTNAAPSRNAGAPQTQSGAPSMSSSNWTALAAARIRGVGFGQCPSGMSGSHGLAVTFNVDRSGNVTSARAAGSSGSGALDQQVVAMVHRASPLPPPPAGVSGGTVPIRVSCQ